MAEVLQQAAVDVVICGGGIAGLWTLDTLQSAGYRCLLLETSTLGRGQTRHAQGIIHGGLKYALQGRVTASAEAVASMPAHWSACLAGQAQPDLATVSVLSGKQFLWSPGDWVSRIKGAFASRLLNARTVATPRAQRPTPLRHESFHGKVWQLDEPVLDTASLVKALAEPHRDAIAKIQTIDRIGTGEQGKKVELTLPGGNTLSVDCQAVVLTAGQGNAGLLKTAGLDHPTMQCRPLHMVMVRGDLPTDMFAHCLGRGSNPRITITSHGTASDETVWYLGGQLAEDGVARSEQEQIEMAQKELSRLLPWLKQDGLRWATLRIDRAEPRQDDGSRPAGVYADWQQGVVTAWPTKLALAPQLAGQVRELLARHGINPATGTVLPTLDFPGYAELPWQESQTWY
jgi:glycerol-3-phosphate dehydrogenase